MADLTILYLYYNQPEAIRFLESIGYEDVNFLFVDDGSKAALKLDWAEVLRIDYDIPWNQPRANNKAFRHLKKGVVLRMDIDHYFDKEDIIYLKFLSHIIQDRAIIHFKRVNKTSHPNIYMARGEDLI